MRNGDVLILGRNVDEAGEISHVVGQALALGLLPGFCLCLLAGAWLSVRAQRRVAGGDQPGPRTIAPPPPERPPPPPPAGPPFTLSRLASRILAGDETTDPHLLPA